MTSPRLMPMRNSIRRCSGHRLVARRHDALDLGRARGRADHAGELGEYAIARGVDDAAAVLTHQRQDHGLVAFQVAHRDGLVLAHEPAVPRDIGSKNGRESAVDRRVFVHHRFCVAHTWVIQVVMARSCGPALAITALSSRRYRPHCRSEGHRGPPDDSCPWTGTRAHKGARHGRHDRNEAGPA